MSTRLTPQSQQLSLWTENEQEKEASAQPSIYDIFVRPIKWADGSNSPDQLERLALTMLYDWQSFTDTNGQRHMFQIIASGIVDGQVLLAYDYYCPLKYFYHMRSGLPIPTTVRNELEDEEDEEDDL